MAAQKKCHACKTVKSVKAFAVAKSRKDGRQTQCRKCRADYYARPEVGKRIRASVRARKFGITAEQYEKLLRDQGGVCAICETSDPKTKTKGSALDCDFCVDHDHATGKVRGLLCNGCNVGIGHFRESVNAMKAAIAYLERN